MDKPLKISKTEVLLKFILSLACNLNNLKDNTQQCGQTNVLWWKLLFGRLERSAAGSSAATNSTVGYSLRFRKSCDTMTAAWLLQLAPAGRRTTASSIFTLIHANPLSLCVPSIISWLGINIHFNHPDWNGFNQPVTSSRLNFKSAFRSAADILRPRHLLPLHHIRVFITSPLHISGRLITLIFLIFVMRIAMKAFLQSEWRESPLTEPASVLPLNCGRYSRRCRPECKILSWKRSILFMNKICNRNTHTHIQKTQSAEGTGSSSPAKRLPLHWTEKINQKDHDDERRLIWVFPPSSNNNANDENNKSNSNVIVTFIVSIFTSFTQNIKINSCVDRSMGWWWRINDLAPLVSVQSISHAAAGAGAKRAQLTLS